MTIIVEDGSGVTGANSFVDLEYATDFFNSRGFAMPANGIEPVLHQGMDGINAQVYVGSKTIITNDLPFPRVDITDADGNPYGEHQIPNAVKMAQVWLAYYTGIGSSLSSPVTAPIKREKVDVLDTEYAVGVNSSTKISLSDLPGAYNLLAHLLKSNSLNGGEARVIRA